MSVPAYELIEGMEVRIQRSNGRVHLALVKTVDWQTKSVAVEWQENNQAKGKEVDIDSILSLNTNISLPQTQEGTSGVLETATAMEQESFVQPSIPKARVAHPEIFRSDRQLRSSRHPAPQLQPAVSESNLSIISRPPSDRQLNRSLIPIAPASSHGRRLPSPISEMEDNESALPAPSSPQDKKRAGFKRRSNCAREVDRIQRNREERRVSHIQKKLVEPAHPQGDILRMMQEYRSKLVFKPFDPSEPATHHRISVCVRKRPLNQKETRARTLNVVSIPNCEVMYVHEPKHKVDLTKYLDNHAFRFDYAFDETTNNETVYRYTAAPLVESIFEKGMATCFAYGQTGSGKTHTMSGQFSCNGEQDPSNGIYALATQDVFRLLDHGAGGSGDLIPLCSYFEIYSGKLYDLLNERKRLQILEDGKQQVQVVGLEEERVSSPGEVLRLISQGNTLRTSGKTAVNQQSSRSHAVFQIILRKPSGRLHGKLSLIDLAGNERGADTANSDRQTRMEGAEINKSLLALKECIRALGRRGAHLPFRASKLTLVLKDSFIGDNSRTCMIAMVSPGLGSVENTLNTLRYADRVKELAPLDGGGHASHNAPPHEYKDSTSKNDLIQTLEVQNKSSEDVIQFHEAMQDVVEMYDEFLSYNNKNLATEQEFTRHKAELYERAENPDFPVDQYVQNLTQILEKQKENLNVQQGILDEFKQRLTAEETASKREVPRTALSAKGRPLSSNVYLKKTIAQGWKAQEVPETELPPGELEKLVGDEVESVGEKRIALQGMLTSQSLTTGDQTAQQDWTKGEVKIPDFHCSRCRDHFYGLTDELCDEETERLRRENILKRGKADKDPAGSPRSRHPRGGGSRSPLPQHRRAETEVNTNKYNTTTKTTTSGINTQLGEGESDFIGGDDNIESNDVTKKKGVKTGNRLSSGQEDDSSLVNTSTSKELEQQNKQNTNKFSNQCDHDIIRDEFTQDGIGTNLDSSHSILNSGSQGVGIGSKEGRHGAGGVGQGTGGTTSGGRRRRGERKGQGKGSDGFSYSETDSDPDGTGTEDRTRKRRTGRKGRGKREGEGSGTEESGSGQEGRESSSRSRGVKNENMSKATQNESNVHTGAEGREGGEAHRGRQFNTTLEGHNESDTNTFHNRNKETYSTGDMGIEIIDTGHRYHRGRGDTGKGDIEADSLSSGTQPGSSGGRAATGIRRGQDGMSQSELSSELLNNLLSSNRPATACPVGSSYSFTLTQPYIFSYYKS
ncbi:hypothetical protein LOD99_2819 [Oopsacas minuta]|uniref:Kinesin motor domain-containing protein n=1 Tax=Oopsacas minuta TaxID=111878 RepID=A0AAV7K303_9METZ|nr:hypothetical protein LOD99_2819 [Oopsacas minuta]